MHGENSRKRFPFRSAQQEVAHLLAPIFWKVDDPMDFVNCKDEKYVPVFYQCGESEHAELLLFLSPLKLHHVEVTRIFFFVTDHSKSVWRRPLVDRKG